MFPPPTLETMKKINANELVGILKEMRRDLLIFGNEATDVDFLGASLPYVEEKANALIDEIKSWKRWLKEVEKRNRKTT